MKATEGLKLVFGSTIVYGIVAACSATSGPSSVASLTEAGGGSSTSGSSTGGGKDGSGGGIIDALTDPVTEASADIATSGTRLKANYYVGSDGSKQFRDWHDTQVNANCNFVPAADGTTRCIPFATVTAGIGSYFSDAGCSQQLAYVAKGCTAPTYGTQLQTVAGCSSANGYSYAYHAWQIGSAYAGTVYTGTPSSCTAVTTAITTYDLYTVGGEVPASNFVQGSIQTDP